MRNCTEDEGGPLGAGLQEQASNHLKLLWSKALVVSVEEKAWQRLCQVRIKEMSASEPLMRCRKVEMSSKPRILADLRDEPGGDLLTVRAASGIKMA